MKFAVMFGNRGFFPGELVASAIEDFKSVLKKNGHEALIMEGAGTRYDAFVRGNWSAAIVEAFSNYLGYEVDRI